MNNRLIEFINKHDRPILYKYQFRFRGGMGTNTAMIILINKILSALDNSDSVINWGFIGFFEGIWYCWSLHII